MIEVSEVFFLLFLQAIRRVSGVTLDKFSPCPDRTERIKLSLWISISEGFSILVLLLDKLVLGIVLDLSTVFSVSVLWVDHDFIELDQSTIHSFLGNCFHKVNRRAALSALWLFIHQRSCKNLVTAVAHVINSRFQIRCLTSVNTNAHKRTAHPHIVMLINQQPGRGSNARVFCWYPPPVSVLKWIITQFLSTPFCYPLLWPCPKMMKFHNRQFCDRLTLKLSRPSFIFLHACTFLFFSTFSASPIHSQRGLGEQRDNTETGPAGMFSWWQKIRKTILELTTIWRETVILSIMATTHSEKINVAWVHWIQIMQLKNSCFEANRMITLSTMLLLFEHLKLRACWHVVIFFSARKIKNCCISSLILVYLAFVLFSMQRC